MRVIASFALPAALLLLVACGGSTNTPQSTPPAPVVASSLVYADPAASTAWRIVKDPASTDKKLVLGLVGPSGLTARGAGLTLLVDTQRVKIAKFENGAYIQDGGILKLTNETPDEPKLLVGGVDGGKLLLGAWQKGRVNPAVDVSKGPVFRFVLEVDPKLNAAPGKVSLSVSKAKAFAANPEARDLETIPVTVGELSLK